MMNAHILAPDAPDTSLSLSSLSLYFLSIEKEKREGEKREGERKREGRKFLTQAKSPSLNFQSTFHSLSL